MAIYCTRENEMSKRDKSIKIQILFACAFFLIMAGCAAKSPLMKASEHGDIHTAQKLIKEGAQINERDDKGYTPLMYAAWSGQTEIVKLLISNGADVNAKDSTGYTPLMYTIWSEKTETAKLLISNGADVDAKDSTGYTPLLLASCSGNLDIANLLIDKGANINVRGNDKSSPLLQASAANYHKLSILLINKGADVNAQNASGATVLHYTNSPVLTEYLLDKNADITLKNKQGWTALRQSIYDKNVGKVALIRKKTNWQGEIYPLTSEETIGRSIYEPEKDMFAVPPDKEKAYKLATHDCNTMLFKNVSAGEVLLDLNWYGLPALARMASNAYRREELFQQCMAIMGFECKNNCSKNINPALFKEVVDSPPIEKSLQKKNTQIDENNKIANPNLLPQTNKEIKPQIKADPQYNQIKGIVLTNGDVIEGQIISMNADVIKIRTTDGNVSSYSFAKEVRRFIKE